ncbi:MAG TPA: hypothetical protein VJ747_17585, partial [Stellaceae bacterium]|nr:hypothetical protein [Stellaceae bacterium]
LAQAPNLPVILCSGFTDSISTDMVMAAGIKAFLTKPVDHANLARLIRELLAAHASSRARQTAAPGARAVDRAH